MRRSIRRTSAAIAGAAVVGTLGMTGASGAGAASPARQPPLAAAPEHAISGARLWVARYDGPSHLTDEASAVAASPDGSKIYVTGESGGSLSGGGGGRAFATVAYSAATGARLWARRYNGANDIYGEAPFPAVAVSPDGTRVYVTGTLLGRLPTRSAYATFAYNAATGAQLWVRRYDGPGRLYGEGSPVDDAASSVGVSPDGSKVYVTGTSWGGRTTGNAFATVAYSAAGTQLWVRRYNGPASGGSDRATSLTVSPGGRVFVTGSSQGVTSSSDYATVAYSAAGTQLWVRRYNGPANNFDTAYAVGVNRGGTRVYVTGSSYKTSGSDYATVAYSAAGTRLWVRRYSGPANGYNGAVSLAVSPAGKVLVTGFSHGTTSAYDYATVAYSAAGTQLWVRRYNGPASKDDWASSVAVPGNSKVYVTGQSYDGSERQAMATVAYNVFTGSQLWARRYSGPRNDSYGSQVTARAGRVFVTGGSLGVNTGTDYATVAYNG